MQPEFLSLSRSGKQRSGAENRDSERNAEIRSGKQEAGAENRDSERKTEIRSGDRRIKWENILEPTGIGEKQM